MYVASLKNSENYKAQPYQYASPSKQIMKTNAKPFPLCTHCGFNDHSPNDYHMYPKCEICGSNDHATSRHNRVILVRGGVLAEFSQSSESSVGVSCNTCGINVHLTTNHSDFEHFKKGEKLQATKSREPTKNGCSRSMTGVKSYLYKYVEQPGPMVVFGDNSSWITEGYGSINCGGIVFSKVAFVNGLKYNLISISQLCDAKYIVQFDDKINHAKHVKRESIIELLSKQSKILNQEMLASSSHGSIWTTHSNIKTDYGTEFRISELKSFCDEKGISQNFSSPYTPKQNGMAEKKNITLIEVARTMLNEAIRFTKTLVDETGINDSSRYPPDEFLHEDDPSRQYQVNSDISYYITPHNRSLTKLTQTTDVPKVITPNEQTHPLNKDTEGHLGNNAETSVFITDLSVPEITQSPTTHHASTSSHSAPHDRWSRYQHIELVNIIDEPTEGILTRSMAAKLTTTSTSECLFADFLSEIEPKKLSNALKHPRWVDAMQEE
ncbi:retrovirus-related pol polyprotein from transposon TNT 1-94 [Tanacetum coccineum]|uniref:Retrovirus-related pol polyprotein from transposon TNT 1-94 n=1 Tax=Tanacetum coccineum TaxID=301880 RepID=A0ABQ5CUQ8_9ASTR